MKCFVIGPIGDAGTSVRADADDFMKYIVTETVVNLGYEAPIRADNLSEPGRITSQIITLLMDADLVIADLTLNNPNVYYELCLRHSLGKPVIHMAKVGTTLSFDIRDNRTIFYTMHSRDAEVAREELAKQIQHIRQDGYKPMNPILETVGIVNLERSAVPEQAALGQLMSMVESFGGNLQELQRAVQVLQRRMPFVGVVSQPAVIGSSGVVSGSGIHTSSSSGVGSAGPIYYGGGDPVSIFATAGSGATSSTSGTSATITTSGTTGPKGLDGGSGNRQKPK